MLEPLLAAEGSHYRLTADTRVAIDQLRVIALEDEESGRPRAAR